MLHLILFQPEIPQNTGNIGRLCAYADTVLHLVYPLGFELSDKHLKRSGMDYWKKLKVCHHKDWQAFLDFSESPRRIWLFSKRAVRSLWDAEFSDGDGLLFGNEGHGAPDWLHEWAGERRLRIPAFTEGLRSLNLATSAGVATYEALRQIHNPTE